MRYALAGLFISLACNAAYANDLVWRSPTPVGHVVRGLAMTPSSDCYATIRLMGGKPYYHPMECEERAQNYLDIGIPLDGPIIKMPKEARSISVRKKDGWIILK